MSESILFVIFCVILLSTVPTACLSIQRFVCTSLHIPVEYVYVDYLTGTWDIELNTKSKQRSREYFLALTGMSSPSEWRLTI